MTVPRLALTVAALLALAACDPNIAPPTDSPTTTTTAAKPAQGARWVVADSGAFGDKAAGRLTYYVTCVPAGDLAKPADQRDVWQRVQVTEDGWGTDEGTPCPNGKILERSAQPAVRPAALPAPGTCKLGSRNGQLLPDPACTPGVANPAVSQATVGATICRSGWTATVRPSSSVTGKIKKQVDVAYGLSTTTQGELDHLISLELGGAPSDPRNLWVEPGALPNPKDAVENQLRRAVCSRLITLTAAQQSIAGDWTTAINSTGLRVAGGKVCLASNPTTCATS
jgi:hypothetical protein